MARMLATSARRSAGVISSGSSRLGTIALLRAVTYGRRFENVGVLLLMRVRTAEGALRGKQANR